MHENFVALEQEKRDRIINAAMCEFSLKGFKNASTNEIVKKAGISKGALFYYFSSKRDLFEFLFRYSIDFFLETSEPRIKELPTDVFKRWIAFTAFKIEIAAQYPDMANFIQNAYREDAQEINDLLKSELERFSIIFRQRIYDGIDLTKFRSDIDVTKALQIIWWVLEGFALLKQRESFDLLKAKTNGFIQTLIDEIENYLDTLKVAFYKEEYW